MSGTIQQTIRPTSVLTLQRYFVGYSTQTSLNDGVRSIYDIALIDIDLMTAFNTRVGERVMRPDYGCKLWDYLMEPMTPLLQADIIQEATRICNLDSRLQTQNVQIFQVQYGFSIQITLLYVPWQVIDTFTASFTANNATYFGTSLA